LIKKICILITLLISYQIFANHKPSYSAFNSKNVPLDHLLIDIMNIHKGTFIEVGAFNGISSSNTKLLEEYYGWAGILIEPSANLFDDLCKNRPTAKCFSCALGSFDQDNSYCFGDFKGHTMSSFTNRRRGSNSDKVLIRSLQSILDECDMYHINFFSLDTEGYELNILKGIDFKKTTFDYILIEIYKDQYNTIIDLLAKHGYELFCCLSDYNRKDNPIWDGTHNDYLFINKSLKASHT